MEKKKVDLQGSALIGLTLTKGNPRIGSKHNPRTAFNQHPKNASIVKLTTENSTPTQGRRKPHQGKHTSHSRLSLSLLAFTLPFGVSYFPDIKIQINPKNQIDLSKDEDNH